MAECFDRVSRSGLLIQNISDKYYTPELCLAAAQQNGMAIGRVRKSFWHIAMINAALTTTPKATKLISRYEKEHLQQRMEIEMQIADGCAQDQNWPEKNQQWLSLSAKNCDDRIVEDLQKAFIETVFGLRSIWQTKKTALTMAIIIAGLEHMPSDARFVAREHVDYLMARFNLERKAWLDRSK